MKVKVFLHFVRTDRHYTPICTAFDSVELELNPPFQNPGSTTGCEHLWIFWIVHGVSM